MLFSKNNILNAIKTIAHALGDLNDDVVYVGGAVIGLYVDDPGAPEIRPTKDIDIVIEVETQADLEKFRKEMAKRKIYFAKQEGIVCRFVYQNILLDVLATKKIGWAPSNIWFKPGKGRAINYDLGGIQIKIMPLAYFLAAKFSAFESRGKDPRQSKDFEDIVYVLDNKMKLVDDLMILDKDVRIFLRERFEKLLTLPLWREAVLAHLEPQSQMERFEMLEKKIRRILQGFSEA